MRKFVLIFIIFLSIATASGQAIQRQIAWSGAVFADYLNTEVSFPNAYVTDDGLPVYHEVVELDGPNTRIELINLVFEPFEYQRMNMRKIRDSLSIKPRYSTSSGKFYAILDFVPIIRDGDSLRRLISYDIQLYTAGLKTVRLKSEEQNASSVLSSGQWLKIKTSAPGVHKITYSQLQGWGFSKPEAVRLYGNGGYMLPKMNDEFYFDDVKQNAIFHGIDGQGEACLFFYSTGTVRWLLDDESGQFIHEQNDYSDDVFYFLSDQGNEKNIALAPLVTDEVTHQASTFNERSFHELELENLIRSGRRWFGEKFSVGQNRSVALPLSNLVDEEAVGVSLAVAGRSGSNSRLLVSLNNSDVDAVNFTPVNTGDVLATYADLETKDYEISASGDRLNVGLRYSASNNTSYAWLDFVRLNYRRTLMLEDQLLFRDVASVGNENITRFDLTVSGTDLHIWDVTDFTQAVAMPYSIENGRATFTVATDELHEFVAFRAGANLPQPELVGAVSNQNLHQLTGMDMVIISHPDFLTEAKELAQFHAENDQLAVEVVTPAKIYNEFSGGAPDVGGIRNFLKHVYAQPNSSLKYVLLFGDGSYDNKSIRGEATNFILTYQSPNSLSPTSSFVTDDFFVLLDDGEGEYTGMIDLGIGRIPASTVTEAKIAVDKIRNYTSTSSLGDWRNVIAFIGDDEDANVHMSQAEGLAAIVNETSPAFNTDKIYFDAYQERSTTSGDRYPGVNEVINNRVKEGVLILNYTGHASETTLAHEKVLGPNDIDNWSNYNKLPIFVTATCEISRFDADEKSGGEYILFNPNGGGIGLFSTTRVVYSNPNYILNKEFYAHVFSQDEQGNCLRMGDVLKRAKNGVNTGINKRNFTLLADPALRLAFPKHHVETETVNGKPVNELTETIGALSVVTIAGRITDSAGNVLTDFDGELVPVVYDKKYAVETLGNDGEVPFNFEMQDHVIYKGVTSVNDGRFEFSFIVPKDISYAVGEGKISYYASNGEIDAHGVFEDFKIGGSVDGSVSDTQGPEVDLYLNDQNFKSGDEVGKNAVLIVDIEDENGVNTIGVGIGHDITAVLDDDDSNILVLNDYYLSEKDSYKKGQVIFPLNNLSVGEHTLKFKVWDVLNNSTEVEIHFVVDSKLEITTLESYPNPANDFANIVFTHNRPDESFDTRVEIYNFSGSLVEVLDQRLGSNGTESLPLVWQINESQMLIRNGAYLFRVIIVADDGYSANKAGKIIISRY
ncbi:type IX secretion system sortase PorU [Sunxiuqinia sp. sy24]|uniref:type IX secretion system sortase PorU n=1 Tax=Sunxiuqinia sp. sy24 TaxID=3461495 RepID=UPI004045607D